MKRLFLVFHGRFPSEKAASLFAAKSCEAFADQGIEVTLLVPERKGVEKNNPHEYYNTKKNFTVVRIPTIDFFNTRFFKKVAFLSSFIVFSLLCFIYLLVKAHKKDIIYSNESFPILLSSLYFPRTLYEVHDFPEQKKHFYNLLFRRVGFILATNTWKAGELHRIFGVVQGKILCERNAVDVKEFDVQITKEDARKKLGIPFNKKVVVYTGHLYSWKGVDTLAEASKILPGDILVIFVGGTIEDIHRFTNSYGNAKNIFIAGQKKHAEIPYWQKVADVLVLPNTAKEDISKFQTSPMKLFEYMASGRPIVATDIPSIREILNEKNSVIVLPDNAESLAGGILEILRNENHAKLITTEAYRQIGFFTWDKRAKRILDFIEKGSQ